MFSFSVSRFPFSVFRFRFPFPFSIFRHLSSVFRFPFSVFRCPLSIFRFPFSVFLCLLSVYRFAFSVFRLLFSVFRFPFVVRCAIPVGTEYRKVETFAYFSCRAPRIYRAAMPNAEPPASIARYLSLGSSSRGAAIQYLGLGLTQ